MVSRRWGFKDLLPQLWKTLSIPQQVGVRFRTWAPLSQGTTSMDPWVGRGGYAFPVFSWCHLPEARCSELTHLLLLGCAAVGGGGGKLSSGVPGSALPCRFGCNEYRSLMPERFYSVHSQPAQRGFCCPECQGGWSGRIPQL